MEVKPRDYWEIRNLNLKIKTRKFKLENWNSKIKTRTFKLENSNSKIRTRKFQLENSNLKIQTRKLELENSDSNWKKLSNSESKIRSPKIMIEHSKFDSFWTKNLTTKSKFKILNYAYLFRKKFEMSQNRRSSSNKIALTELGFWNYFKMGPLIVFLSIFWP